MDLGHLQQYAPLATVVLLTAGLLLTLWLHRRQRRHDLNGQLEAVIREHDANLRDALHGVTGWPPHSNLARDLLRNAYVEWSQEALERGAGPSDRTIGRLQEVLHRLVTERFQKDYDYACREGFERKTWRALDLKTADLGDVLSLAHRLPPMVRLRLMASYRRSQEQLTPEIAWMFRSREVQARNTSR